MSYKLKIHSNASESNTAAFYTYRLVNKSNTEYCFISCLNGHFDELYHNVMEALLKKAFNLEILKVEIHRHAIWSSFFISDEDLFYFKLKYLDNEVVIDKKLSLIR